MDQNDATQLMRDLEGSPGIIVGIVMLVIAIAIFSPAARAMIDYRLSKLLGAFAIVGTVLLCGFGYLSQYLS
ncbi:hypothetical protein [Glycomyces sp. NPDC021274]|uniref:hypothetical protein n=1 Tax=Glycomyces sp. NPDC021274 TaxID=3155120 RepID=UPI0034012415